MLLSERERQLVERVAPVLRRRFEELVEDWQGAWAQRRGGDEPPPLDLPTMTRTALEEGIEAGTALQKREAERLVGAGVPLEDVVGAVLVWEETVLRRLARDAVEDIFSGATAINRFIHQIVLLCAEGYGGLLAVGQDAVRRGLEDADRLKSELISNISHDLKTPLTAIQACTVEMLEAGELTDEERRRFLELILQNAERLSRLISRILDVSRIEARAVDLTRAPLDLGAHMRRLVEGIAPTAPVRVDIDPDLPDVWADQEAVERILVNLIDNAVRFSEEGAPVVVRARGVGDGVEIQVVDRGPGIPPDRREGLFSKFYQVDPSPGGRRSGSGLGLAIVRGLADAMGGSVGYRPNDPSGSVFWVRLPVAEGEEPDR